MRGKGEGSIFKDSRGLWTAKVELPPAPNGDRRRRVVRSRDKAVVIAKLSELRKELDRTGDLPTSTVTVETWMLYWLDNIAARRVRPLTLVNYRSVTVQHIIPAIGRIRLDKLTAPHIRGLHAGMLKTGLSSTYVRNTHRVLSGALTDAVQDGKTTRNVASMVDTPKQSRTRLEALDVGEAVSVIATCVDAFNTEPYDPAPALFATYVLTGTRRGEIAGLEIDRITDVLDLSWQLQRIPRGTKFEPDFEYRHIVGGLYWTRPKSSAGWRIIPLVEPLASILREHLARSPRSPYGLVFTRDGAPLDPSEISRAWHDFHTAHRISDKHVRLHDLRHSTVDLLYEAQVPEDAIQEIVGHSTRAMTRRYKSRGNVKRLTDAMLQLSALVNAGGSDVQLEPAPHADAAPR